ncbi:glycerophosphodiester phosphodiesterase family protein [Flavobacterium sp. SUN052]|uniref:glycerophosphodiester phosphodiesterase n=1 Tax=Flavobacterium sp. SUN052 TaxID=3002441 RepID=UPI00237E106A|nr:glycerophosphodiester phosphodiesterase family protein [Flavobacterium sp. SUN052]MEC4004600.1 glycerophosphodiester phosphodiesterase family protein [Flavobacterium sp. SUN052]
MKQFVVRMQQLESNKMLKIGHRGAKGYVAENTLASFQKALDLGVDGIELDVHLSKDNVLVVIHDETIDRTTSKKGIVNDFSSFELQKLEIPTLEEVFNLINKQCFINIEIKDAKATIAVAELVQKYILEHNWNHNLFQISSFNWNVLENIFKLNPTINLGILTENTIEDAIVFAKQINAYSINPYFKLLNTENVNSIHQNRFKIYTWTVNSNEDITFVKSLKVDGIISDYPDRVCAFVISTKEKSHK